MPTDEQEYELYLASLIEDEDEELDETLVALYG